MEEFDILKDRPDTFDFYLGNVSPTIFFLNSQNETWNQLFLIDFSNIYGTSSGIKYRYKLINAEVQ